jgi:stage V sporulation protein D (sporulation-specific penicillin-binding protein)
LTKKKKGYKGKIKANKRMGITLLILSSVFFLLFLRLFYIMVVKGWEYSALAEAQWTSQVTVEAERGRILDRNGEELAISASVYRVDLDMNTLRETMTKGKLTTDQVSEKLANALGMQAADVKTILNGKLSNGKPISYAIQKRKVEKAQADSITALKLRGVIISSDTKRYYPNGNFLAHALGFLNSDGQGLAGLELQYNSLLAGTPGKKVAETDRKSEDLPYSSTAITAPVDGKDLILTIDEVIQNIAEKTAEKAMQDNKAKAVTIIVMDPNNGDILAMVNKPDYDPNNPWETGKTSDELQAIWRNRAVSDTYEPGSIFKVITSVAALETGAVNSNSSFTCTGSFTIAGHTIHCWQRSGHGVESFVDILKNSCNSGFAEVGAAVGKEKLTEYIKKAGFGEKTGIDLPGEASGIVKDPKDITALDLATISFGQTNTVSCIEYLTAFNAVANGGKLITPHLMYQTGHYDEATDKEVADSTYDSASTARQVFDSAKTAELRSYLEKVVSEGGGSKAFIDGYHIAGKTGTAQKAGIKEDGKYGYMENKYIASFAGMAPASNPKITVFIQIDEPDPSNYYAGQIAAPVAQTVFNDIFNYMAMKSDASGEEIAKSLLRDVVVPDVRGMTKTEAQAILASYNLDYVTDSAGDYIVKMEQGPGTTVKEGSKITLYTGTTANYNKVVTVPDLKGLGREKANQTLSSIGLKGKYTGNGMVTSQSIAAGTTATKGSVVGLELDPIGD